MLFYNGHSLGVGRGWDIQGVYRNFMGEIHDRLFLVNILYEYYHDYTYQWVGFTLEPRSVCLPVRSQLEGYGGSSNILDLV